MKQLLFVFSFIFLSFSSLHAQSNSTIKGILTDTLDNALIMATVLLLDEIDSTMVSYTRCEMDGSFKFKDVDAGNYLVKTTYVGYLPLSTPIDLASNQDLDLGQIKMTEIAEALMEVVIKAAKAPIKMRGDTIEYDATTFQVPEGATVEDLLRRLPGMEVAQDGSIEADGKEVTKVTVDGKSFFGNDPKAATKNLPAEGISKVQVFDTKTEEEKVTGLSATSEKDKTMNLELKEEFKKGGFGKIIAGVGTESRRELKGNYNKFNKTIQFSIVGVANNTGRNGLSWNDYRDFMGSQSFNFDFGGGYGFGGGGGMHRIIFGGGERSIESNIQSIFFDGQNNGGFPENYNGGANLNFDNKKTKASAVYFYNRKGLIKNVVGQEDKFLTDATINESNITNSDEGSTGHRTELEVEHEIDSLHTIKFEFDAALVDENNQSFGNISLSENGIRRSGTNFDNSLSRKGYLVNSALTFRKKFKKKGRRFGANATFLTTELDDQRSQRSDIMLFDNTGSADSLINVNQEWNDIADKKQIGANAVYVEPLSKKFFLQSFYNFSNRVESGLNDVYDIEGQTRSPNMFLTRSFENSITSNRFGSAIRYSHDGTNVSVGVGYLAFDLQGTLMLGNTNDEQNTVSRNFNNIIPHFNFEFSPVRNASISLGYERSAQEPNVADLQPVVDNRNPLYIRTGNPSLTPEITNDISFNARRSFPLSGTRIGFGASYSIYENQISTDEGVNDNLISFVSPINVDDGTAFSSSVRLSFPIVKNKFTVRTNARYRLNKRTSFVNTFENITTTNSLSPSVRLSITPHKNVGIYLNANWNFIDTKYDINITQDQRIENHSYNVEFNAKTLWGIYLNSSFDFATYTNDRFGFNQQIPILNASIYKHVLKGNKLELRLSIYDALNESVGISQSTFGNRVLSSTTQAIGRYLMFSMAYDLRGLKDGVQKNGWW